MATLQTTTVSFVDLLPQHLQLRPETPEVIGVTDYQGTGETLLTRLEELKEYSKTLKLVKAAGLAKLLSQPGLTMFVHTDLDIPFDSFDIERMGREQAREFILSRVLQGRLFQSMNKKPFGQWSSRDHEPAVLQLYSLNRKLVTIGYTKEPTATQPANEGGTGETTVRTFSLPCAAPQRMTRLTRDPVSHDLYQLK